MGRAFFRDDFPQAGGGNMTVKVFIFSYLNRFFPLFLIGCLWMLVD
jgi:hypothetical protein